MTYPVAYRKDSQEYTDWPRPKGARDIQTRKPRPANDNVPDPANDNISELIPEEIRQRVNARTLSNAGRFLGRKVLPKLNPYADAISIGVQIGEMINEFRRPIITPGTPGGGEASLDLTGWDWEGSPFNYPADRPYWVRFQVSDYFGITYADTIEELPGHAASPADNAIDALGSVYWQGGDAQYMLKAPDMWHDGLVDPWVETGGSPETVRWVVEPTRDRRPSRIERENSDSGGEEIPAHDPEVWINTRHRLNTWAVSTGVTIRPGGAIADAPFAPPRIHINRPPPKGTKEKKFIASARGTIVAVFGGVTEVSDMVDALWEALPKSRRYGYYLLHKKGGGTFWKRRHGATMGRKMRDIWGGLDDLDLNEAIWNLATNQLEDAAIGKLGKAAQKAQKPWLDQLGRPLGLGAGPAL